MRQGSGRPRVRLTISGGSLRRGLNQLLPQLQRPCRQIAGRLGGVEGRIHRARQIDVPRRYPQSGLLFLSTAQFSCGFIGKADALIGIDVGDRGLCPSPHRGTQPAADGIGGTRPLRQAIFDALQAIGHDSRGDDESRTDRDLVRLTVVQDHKRLRHAAIIQLHREAIIMLNGFPNWLRWSLARFLRAHVGIQIARVNLVPINLAEIQHRYLDLAVRPRGRQQPVMDIRWIVAGEHLERLSNLCPRLWTNRSDHLRAGRPSQAHQPSVGAQELQLRSLQDHIPLTDHQPGPRG